jgi:LPS export ABC transporter protein LptC
MVALAASATVLLSCEDKTPKLSAITDPAQVPTLEIDSLYINYTESGRLRMNLRAPLMQRFMMAEEPYNLFPKGMHIHFYAPTGELESEIIANYAYNREKPEEYWKAVGNVVVYNYPKQQTLYTDTLYWDRARKQIYTDAPVRIIAPAGEIPGHNGMTSDERFENYDIRNVNDGLMYVAEEPDSTATAVKIEAIPQ